MAVHFVARAEDIAEGQHRIVEVQGRSVGIYHIDGEFYALHNSCPHAGAPLCQGQVVGTRLPSNVYEYEYGRQGEIVRCPWHGWEFEIKTGVSLVDPKVRARTYKAEVVNGQICITL